MPGYQKAGYISKSTQWLLCRGFWYIEEAGKMKDKRWLLGVFLSLVFVLGCAAGKEGFKMGQELSKEGRWGDAIKFYEEALKEDPKNTEYLQALTKATKELALIHYSKGRESLAANPDPSLPELKEIFKDVELAHSLDPENKAIITLFSDLAKRKEELLANVKSVYDQAGSHLANKEWLDAIWKLKMVNRLFPGYEETGDRLAKAEEKAAKIFYTQGVELGKKEDWRMAVQALREVIDINPNYYDIQQLYKTAQANNSVDYFINKGGEAIATRHWDRAITLYERALEYEPDNEQLINRLEALRLKGGEEHFGKAMKFSSQRRLNRAVEEFLIALKYSPSLVDSRLYKEFFERFCQRLDQRSDVYIELKKWGNALVWLGKLQSIAPDYEGLFHKLQLAREKIKTRIRKSIAVFDFSSQTENRDAGRIIASKLISFLSKNASGDLKIIQRENLQSILKDLQLGQDGLVDIDTAKKVGKMRGIDTFILGDVLHFSSKGKNYPSTDTVRVQVDTRTEDNPAFERWRIVHPRPTEKEMRTAPPMKIERPVYKLYTYETGRTKIIGLIEIVYKLVDTMTGEVLFTNTISGKLTRQDDYHHGLSAANIKEDRLELPTEVEILNELTNQKVSELGLSVLRHFQGLELAYFKEGEKQLKRRKYEEAIERYTDAIFDERLKGISSPISKKSSEMIAKIAQDM